MDESRFKLGAYVTDGTHLFEVKAVRTEALTRIVVVVEDCATGLVNHFEIGAAAKAFKLVRGVECPDTIPA